MPFSPEQLWLGAVYSSVGESDRYVDFYRGQLARTSDPHHLARGCVVVALLSAGRDEEALAASEGLVEAAETTRNPYAISFALMARGMAQSAVDPVSAQDALRRGLVVAQESGNRANVSYLAMTIAMTLNRIDGDTGESLVALDNIAVAIRNYHDSGNVTQMRAALGILMTFLDRRRDYEPAAVVAGFAAVSPTAAASVAEFSTAIAHLREVLGAQTYAMLAQEGAAMTMAARSPSPTTKSTEFVESSGNYREDMAKLKVGAAYPDPPFNGMPHDGGLDIDLMTAVAGKLNMAVEFVPYEGADFNGIFDALNGKDFDCVAAGTTVTPERETKAAFAPPYLISGQSLAVDTRRLPNVGSVDDLEGLTIGVQQGNTSGPIAERLVADGKAARVRVYDYGSIRAALDDLTTGGCDVFMKLAPVLTELVKPIGDVEVVQRGISTENIAIAVGLGDQELLARITVAQAELEEDGTLQRIRRKWLGNPYTDQSLGML